MQEPISSPSKNNKFSDKHTIALQRGVDSITDYAIFLLNPEGIVNTWNKGAENIWGYTAKEIIGHSVDWFYKIQTVDPNHLQKLLDKAKAQGHCEDESWCVRRDGSTFWANTIITPIYNEQGILIHFMKVMRDLTERENATKNTVALQRGIDSITDYAVFLLNPEGIVNTWNKGAENISGYTAKEIIGHSVDWFYKIEKVDLNHLQNLLEKAKAQGHCEYEGWCVRRDGSTFWTNTIITPIYNDQGTLINFMKVMRDLTERENATSVLRQSERNYRTLAELSPVGIFHINRQREIIYANEQGYKIIGMNAEEIRKANWLNAIHPDDQMRVLKEWENSHEEEKVFRSEFRFLHKNNKAIWVLSIARPEIDQHTNIVSYIQTIVDINDRKSLELQERERLISVEKEEQMQRKRVEAEIANKNRLTNYIDMFTHGLRNPLTGIKGSTLFVQEDVEDIEALLDEMTQDPVVVKKKITQYINDIKDQMKSIAVCVQHSTIVTNDVLNLSQLENHSKKLDIKPFHVQKALASVAAMYRGVIREKKLELIIMPYLKEELMVKGDSHYLEQVLINLITNAIKFTTAGKITLSFVEQEVTASEVVLQFKVEDTGRGMTEEEMQHVFKRFEQGSKWISHEYGGSGLGLYLSKQLVELMGGEITFNSEKGKGSTFIFTMRCGLLSKVERGEINQSETKNNIEKTSPVIEKNSGNILIVEDNTFNQKILAKNLGSRGYQYQIANNGREAVKKWRSFSFDAILMDIEMPEMNGIDATVAIRQEEKALSRMVTPIIGLSGNARPEQKETALTAGMNDYLIKPYDIEKITQTITSFSKKTLSPIHELATATYLEKNANTANMEASSSALSIVLPDAPKLSQNMSSMFAHPNLESPVVPKNKTLPQIETQLKAFEEIVQNPSEKIQIIEEQAIFHKKN